MKAECNAKICIVLSIAEAHPRIAVCRTAKRAFGFLPKAKACLREQDTEFIMPNFNVSYGLRVTHTSYDNDDDNNKRNLQPVTAVTFRFEELGILFA